MCVSCVTFHSITTDLSIDPDHVNRSNHSKHILKSPYLQSVWNYSFFYRTGSASQTSGSPCPLFRVSLKQNNRVFVFHFIFKFWSRLIHPRCSEAVLPAGGARHLSLTLLHCWQICVSVCRNMLNQVTTSVSSKLNDGWIFSQCQMNLKMVMKIFRIICLIISSTWSSPCCPSLIRLWSIYEPVFFGAEPSSNYLFAVYLL